MKLRIPVPQGLEKLIFTESSTPNMDKTNDIIESNRVERGAVSPLFTGSTARRYLAAVFLVLVLFQGLYLVLIGNKLTFLTDGFSESNALRAADAYIKEGITSYHGLPRQTYGTRFSEVGFRKILLEKDGTVRDNMRVCLPPAYADPNKWVYTHYPEGPDVMLALTGKLVGLDHLILLRLFPLAFNLLATAVFFISLARVFGYDRAVLIAAACVALPMFHACMPALHFQGYSFALLLLEISLLMRVFWSKPGELEGSWIMMFLLGFLQGWLSFDLFFIVTFIAWPLWLLRKAEGGSPSIRILAMSMALPLIGFGLAHILHFLQVAGETGGIQGAIADFKSTAMDRAGALSMCALPDILQKGILNRSLHALDSYPYLQNLIVASYEIFRNSVHPKHFQLAPTFPIIILILFRMLAKRGGRVIFSQKPSRLILSWPERGSALVPLGAALAVSSIWLVLMTGYSVINAHIVSRHFFVFYLMAVIVIAKSVQICRASDYKKPGACLPEKA